MANLLRDSMMFPPILAKKKRPHSHGDEDAIVLHGKRRRQHNSVETALSRRVWNCCNI